jgi:hypothetical protein
MAEPQGNHGDVDSGVQKVHGRGVPEDMHRGVFMAEWRSPIDVRVGRLCRTVAYRPRYLTRPWGRANEGDGLQGVSPGDLLGPTGWRGGNRAANRQVIWRRNRADPCSKGDCIAEAEDEVPVSEQGHQDAALGFQPELSYRNSLFCLCLRLIAREFPTIGRPGPDASRCHSSM